MTKNDKESNNKNTTEEIQQPKRCFVIMPFSDPEGYSQGHFRKIYEQILEPAIEDAGFKPIRVDENKISDQIIMKIFDGIINCEMAICDLSSNNPNVLYELGLRHAYDKPVVLIHDDRTNLIFDIQGISILQYRSARLYDEVIIDRGNISEAITETESNSSGYSIVNMINLKKATYDTNTKDSPEFNKALLLRVLNALETSEKNQNAFYSKLKNEQDQIGNYITNIDNRIDELNRIIKNAINKNISIDINKIGYELNDMLEANDYHMSSSSISFKQRDYLNRQRERIYQLMDNLYEFEDKFSSSYIE